MNPALTPWHLTSKPVPVEINSTYRTKKVLMNRFMRHVRNMLLDLDKSIYGDSHYRKLLDKNIENGFKDTYPDFLLDYPKIILVRGTLDCGGISIGINRFGQLQLRWRCISGVWDAQRDDLLFIGLFYRKLQNWHLIADAAHRSDRQFILEPKLYQRRSLHVYTGFISQDRKRVSNIRHVTEIREKEDDWLKK